MRMGMRRMSLRMRRGWRGWRRRPWLAFIPTKTSKFLQTRKHLKFTFIVRQVVSYCGTISPEFVLQNDFHAIFSFGKLLPIGLGGSGLQFSEARFRQRKIFV